MKTDCTILKNLGFPTRRNEEWKYTNITPYLQEKYIIDGVNLHLQNELIAKAIIPHLDWYQLVLINGELTQPTQPLFLLL